MDELHKALDAKFIMSTAFKTPEELAKIREAVLTTNASSGNDRPDNDTTPVENETELGRVEAGGSV